MSHKQYIAILVLLAMVALATSQGFRSFGNKKHPTLDHHCYDEEHKLTIKVNDTIFPTGFEYQCFKMFCRDDYVLDVSYCPRGTPTCGKKPDFSKPFPECCSAC
ncbi:uncharacterized protein LOC106084124 [Stomoxys calcitrans]|uniref:Single domain-containing protein n=1 Tax=Stomoxys calcitrans TaxID=35570 RepID=A0A1I8PDJ2_STOCA|nr:uncharacterized protein LOC106084124 [Stomoxys calcitrans]